MCVRFAARVALSALFAITFLSVQALHASTLPVFPDAIGFGVDTPAGRAATDDINHIYEVTTLADNSWSNPVFGTLRYGIEKVSGPRVIVFKVSGVIALRRDLIVRANDANGDHGNLTIAGQTAPFPGITLKNGGIRIFSHDILIQHIAIRPGKLANPDSSYALTSINNRDCLGIEKGSDRVVVDHISCSWATDEQATTWWDAATNTGTETNITISNSIIADPIQYSGHLDNAGREEQHGFGVLVGAGTSNMSIIGNVMAFNWSRNPLVRHNATGAQIVNNYVYRPGPNDTGAMYIGAYRGWDASDPDHADDPYRGDPMAVSAIGNVVVHAPAGMWNQKNTDTHEEGLHIHRYATTELSLFLSGNYSYNPDVGNWNPVSGDQYSAPFFSTELPLSQPKLRLPGDPYLNSGGRPWAPLRGNAQFLVQNIVRTAGKFSGQRDAIDAALVARVDDPLDASPINDSTWLIREEDLGSNPWSAVNIQNPPVFTKPNNPTGDDDQDGYTNLEEELHRRAAIVEGRPITDPLSAAYDTFTDGNANGWTTTVPGTTGNWAVSGGALRLSGAPQNGRALLTQSNWTDQVVEARVAANLVPNTTGFVAVYARFNGVNDTYYMTMRNTKLIELKRIKTNPAGGAALITTFDTATLSGLDLTAPHVLRLEIKGSTLRGFVDNLEVVTGTDGTDGFVAGRAGVGAFQVDASFDNVFASPFATAVAYPGDDFDDRSPTDWNTSETGAGTWTVTADTSPNWVLTQSAVTGNTRATSPEIKTEQAVQTRVKVTGGSGFVAAFARYQNAFNSYYLLLRLSTRTLELKKIVNNVSTDIDKFNLPASFDFATWHTLRIEATGDASTTTLRGYIDGNLRVSGSAGPNAFTAGKASVGTFQTAAKFDDIVLTSP